MGVVIRRYINFLILLIPTPLVLYSSFLQQHPYFLVDFFNVFSFLFMLFLCNIANVAKKISKIVQKSRSRRCGDIIISTSTLTMSPETSTCEVPSDFLWKLQLTLCTIMA